MKRLNSDLRIALSLTKLSNCTETRDCQDIRLFTSLACKDNQTIIRIIEHNTVNKDGVIPIFTIII